MKIRVNCDETKKWWQIRRHDFEIDPLCSYIADGYFVTACRRCKVRISELLPFVGQ